MTTTTGLTKPQIEVIRRMVTESPTMHRIPGGFWCTPSTTRRPDGIPTWFADVRTIYAMEAKGILQRSHMHSEEWKDERIPGPRFAEYRGAALSSYERAGEGK